MEYTNDLLKEMEDRRKYNKQYASWLEKMAKQKGIILSSVTDKHTGELITLPDREKSIPESLALYNRGQRMAHCLDLWIWNVYQKAKIMDLQKVNLCRDIRFCPNCKVLETTKYIHKITPVYKEMLEKGYHFYFLTLTVPSVKAETDTTLREAVSKLYKCFTVLKDLYGRDIDDKNAFHGRSVDFAGGIRVLEITHNAAAGYHPHLHCIIVTNRDIPEDLMKQKYKARYSRKRKSFDYKSDLECELAKIWTLIYYNLYSEYNYSVYDYDPAETNPVIRGVKREDVKNLEVNFRELDPSGFRETFKYTVKSSEIKSFAIFKQFYIALLGRRIRQGFGCLYKLKLDDCMDDVGEEQPLPLECLSEEPERLLTARMKELYTVWAEYKKISRFNPTVEKLED